MLIIEQFGRKVSHPSVRVLGGLVVVPDTEPSDGLDLVKGHMQGVGLSIGERNQPHVLVIGSNVDAIYDPKK